MLKNPPLPVERTTPLKATRPLSAGAITTTPKAVPRRWPVGMTIRSRVEQPRSAVAREIEPPTIIQSSLVAKTTPPGAITPGLAAVTSTTPWEVHPRSEAATTT